MSNASHELHIGQLVLIDDRFTGEILETMLGGFFRVEIDVEKTRHEYWTVRTSRISSFESQ